MSQAQQMSQKETSEIVSLELINEVQQFLYREARINDAEKFRDWLDMLAEDIHYWIPYRYQRYRKDAKEPTIYDAAYFNDNYTDLEKRVRRTEAASCWSEDPATRVAHVVTNIEVELTDNPGELRVYSLVTLRRNMNEDDEHTVVGHREDLLRRVNGVLKLAKRKVIMDQNIFLNKKLNTFL
jgi:ethylbenzene dioxygenase beta subunit